MATREVWPHGKLDEPGWVEQDYPCTSPGYVPYKDMISVNLEPSEVYTYIGSLEDTCWVNCGEEEAGEHTVRKEFLFESGWSIGGNFAGDTANLWKVCRLTLGINASYSEKTQVREVITHSFPHGRKKEHRTDFNISILQVERTWTGTVTRYYYSTYPGQHALGHMGEITFTEYSKKKGKPSHVDIPCAEWEEPTPFSPEKTLKIGSTPRSILEIKDYTPKSMRYALGHVASNIKMNITGKDILTELLSGQSAKAEKLITDYQFSDEPSPEDAVIRWLALHKSDILNLDDTQKQTVKEIFKLGN